MIAQGGHVTPCIESNPLTACTRIGLPRFWEAAERRNKYNIYSKIQSLKQPSYKVEMHKYGAGREGGYLQSQLPSGPGVDNIRHPDFPESVRIRHRLWTSVTNATGRVDLTISTVLEPEREDLKAAAVKALGGEVIVEPFRSNKEGIQVSLRVPEMRQATGFREAAARDAFSAIGRLTRWYFKYGEKGNSSRTSPR